uniref:NADH-ubiquinone oxidoreductase chain 1 n=1 Tax=Ophiocomina nigra TaxID=55617 RepID=D3H5T7_9ECHI|nr:NADH dehydrogenase subunit 1 [Ophiocomina nigra]
MSLLVYLFVYALGVVSLLVPILLAVALLTLLERKVLGYMQFRKGPNLVGPLGTLQPIADGLKLFIKENFKPSNANPIFFYLAPVVFFLIALLLWSVVPLEESNVSVNLSLLFVISISSLSVYGVLSAGWSSNSKYSLLGAIRGVAQMISYEVSLGLVLLSLVILVGGWSFYSSLEIQGVSVWSIIPCLPLFLLWYISTLAETNRSPFDLAEGESELVSGYNVEYAGAPFALFFIGEYANIILMNVVSVILFLGGGSLFVYNNVFLLSLLCLSFKAIFLVFSFLWVRASFPRVRYDQLMMLMWKGFLPISISLIIWYFVLITLLGGIPVHY